MFLNILAVLIPCLLLIVIESYRKADKSNGFNQKLSNNLYYLYNNFEEFNEIRSDYF